MENSIDNIGILRMKKIYRIVLVLAIALLCIGCGKQEENDLEKQIDTQESESSEIIQPEPEDDDLVLILDYIPDMVIDLKYATTDNVTGQVIYENDDAYLRYGTVNKLMQVQAELTAQGYKLLLWDGYRPVAASYKVWYIGPE